MRTQNLVLIAFIIIIISSCRKDPSWEYSNFKFDFSAEWTYRNYNEYTGSVAYTVLDTNRFWFDGDTVMTRFTRYGDSTVSTIQEQHIYHRLYFNQIHYLNPDEGNEPMITQAVRGYVREDTSENRLYITYTFPDSIAYYGWDKITSEEEALLFDFSLDVNDSLDWCRWYEGYTIGPHLKYDAVAKETIYVGNYKFDKIDLYRNGYYQTSLLKGIGAIDRIDRKVGELIHFHCNKFDYYP
jgi:hypothetical protein